MPEHEAQSRAFYDHESDEPARSNGGRRRRPAADWGVGEDIFDRMPSRRFARGERRAEHHSDEQPRRAERDEAPSARHDAIEARRAERRPVRERHIETWDDEAIAAWAGEEAPREAPRTIVIETSSEDAVSEIATDGRRTIVISGHPDRLPAPRASRAPRTALDRIGARPDRIVGYSVALGFLLILIAILTT